MDWITSKLIKRMSREVIQHMETTYTQSVNGVGRENHEPAYAGAAIERSQGSICPARSEQLVVPRLPSLGVP